MNLKRRQKRNPVRKEYIEKRSIKKNFKKREAVLDKIFKSLFAGYIARKSVQKNPRFEVSYLLSIEGRSLRFHFFLDGKESLSINQDKSHNSLDSFYKIGGLFDEEKENCLRNFLIALKGDLLKGFKNEARGIEIAKKLAKEKSLFMDSGKELDDRGVDFLFRGRRGNKVFYYQVKSSSAGVKYASGKTQYKGRKIHFIVVNDDRSDLAIYKDILKVLSDTG